MKLAIIPIYPPYIYSVRYEGEEENEFDRLFSLWDDVSFIVKFMDDNKEYLKSDIWQNTPEPEEAARQVIDEADKLEDFFEELFQNTINGKLPDFDTHFHFLDGKYKYEIKWIPMKSYGTGNPSFLRIYAIKMGKNTYLITGGGIKLADTIQDSPDLKDHVLQDIEKVRKFLIDNGIIDSDDLKE